MIQNGKIDRQIDIDTHKIDTQQIDTQQIDRGQKLTNLTNSWKDDTKW